MKKILFIILILLLCGKAEAASRWAKAAGGNYSATSTWSNTSSAGADSAPVPTALDDVFFDTGSIGAVTVNLTTCAAKSVTVSAGTLGTLTLTAGAKLIVAGNVTFVSGFTLGGTGDLEINATSNMTSAGLVIPGNLTLTSSGAKTLKDNWTVTGLVKSNASTTQALNGFNLTCNGGLNMTGSTSTSGTTEIILGGTAKVWSGTGDVSNNLTINCTSATISGTVSKYGKTLQYIAGTITTTDSNLTLTSNVNLSTSGMTWDNIRMDSNLGTIKLLSDLSCSGTLQTYLTTNSTFSGLYNVSCGNLTIQLASSIKFPANQTLTVTNGIFLIGNATRSDFCGITSDTPSWYTNLKYTGTSANCNIAFANFTDVNASNSTQALDVWYGGDLIRTSGINNRTSADIGGGTSTNATSAYGGF